MSANIHVNNDLYTQILSTNHITRFIFHQPIESLISPWLPSLLSVGCMTGESKGGLGVKERGDCLLSF